MRTPIVVLATLVLGSGVAGQSPRHDLFVSSRNTHSVKRFHGETGDYLGDFVASGAGGLNQTQEVAFGPDGHLYVTGRGNAHVLRFDGQTGAFLGPFTSGYDLDEPTKMTFGPDGMLYVSQWGQRQDRVAKFDARTGVFAGEATATGLLQGMAHAWTADGTMYVASYGSKDVRRFGPNGDDRGIFTAPDVLLSAVNLWFGSSGDLFVADWEAGRVRRFDGASGAFEGDFITGLTRVEGVTVGPDGLLYLCDWQENRILRFDAATGAPRGVFAEGGGLQQPNGLVFGPAP